MGDDSNLDEALFASLEMFSVHLKILRGKIEELKQRSFTELCMLACEELRTMAALVQEQTREARSSVTKKATIPAGKTPRRKKTSVPPKTEIKVNEQLGMDDLLASLGVDRKGVLQRSKSTLGRGGRVSNGNAV